MGSLATVYVVASSAALALALLLAGVAALTHYRALPDLAPLGEADPQPARWPSVSIVVPARNEERTLPALLASLRGLEYPSLEILIVDDCSTDATPRLLAEAAAASGGRLRVLAGSNPPSGWTGKNHACHLGATAARSEWLLFTDADTVHAPTSLCTAVAAAIQRGAQALSLFPAQECRSFWERLLLPFAYQQYFVGARPRPRAPATGSALANGQYLLVARAAYDAAGGHTAVAGSIVEDVALAATLQRAGYPPLVYRASRLVRVRMYDRFSAITEGFTKNAFAFLREQRLRGALVAGSTACAAGSVPALATAVVAGLPLAVGAALVGCAVQMALFAPWLRAFGAPRRYAVLAPLAALVFTAIALSSLLHVVARRPVRWKGRGYQVLPRAQR